MSKAEDVQDDVTVPEVSGSEVADVDAKDEDTKVSDVEAEALKMGWTPREAFKGDPDKWRPADEFVDRGKNMLPIVKATVKKQEREIAELKQTMKQFGEYHNQTEQRAYAKAMNDLKQQRADAIAAGDGVAFDKVDGEIDALKKEVEQKNQDAVRKTNADEDPVYVEWKSKNKWVDDPEMEKHAIKVAENLRAIGASESGNEFLDRVKDVVKLKFPEKFTNPRREAAPNVEGGTPAPRKGGKSFADMPADARAACDRMAKNAYSDKPKEMAQFKAEYIKNYFEEA